MSFYLVIYSSPSPFFPSQKGRGRGTSKAIKESVY